MKKLILLASSALLLFAGCAKEKFAVTEGEGGPADVTFEVAIPSDGSKAVADGDGAAANVNRCIMEIYYGDELFTRMYARVQNKAASFTLQLVSNRTYKVAFWADCIDDTIGEAIATDKYYTTNAQGGLQAVAIKDDYLGNDDARDAFALCKNYTVAQAGGTFNAVLRRPFAQINVITTDVATVAKVAALVPDKVDLVIKNAVTTYNVLDSTAVSAQVANLAYQANVYNWDPTKAECTLSMDYIFAEKDKAVIDIDWKALHGSDAAVAHSFTAIPYQRNYRTNIKGALLTTIGKWNVTIEPTWNSPEHPVPFYTLDNIQNLNEFLASSQAQSLDSFNIEVTMPSDSDNYDVNFGAGNDGQDITISFTGQLGAGKTLGFVNQPGASGPSKLTVSAPSGSSLDFDSEQSHVNVNGTSYENISGTVSANTLVISAPVAVANLEMNAGAVEMHGTITNLLINETAHATNPVLVRDSEGLSEAVITIAAPYVDVENGYAVVKRAENNYDVVAGAAPQIAKIGEKKYYSLQSALDAVEAGQTIELLGNLAMASGVHFNKDITAILDLKGYTFKVTKDTQHNCRAIKTLAGTLTVKNGTIDARNVDAQGNPSPIYSGDNVDIYGATRSEDGSVLNLQDLTIYSNHYNGMSLKYITGSAGEVRNCVLYCNYGGGVEAAGGTVDVIGTEIHQSNMAAGNEYVASGVGMSSNGVANVTDCTIDATYAAFTSMTSGGTINVNGGTYSAGNGNGYAAHCYLSYWADHSHDSFINLSDGTFSGKFCIEGDGYEETAHIVVSGGYYSVDPTSFLKTGCKATAQGTTPETWFVDENGGAKIGNTIYDTFAKALAAAQNGDTITLLKDFTINSTVRIVGKTLTIDWSNYTMKMTGNSGGASTPMMFSGCNITMKGNKGGIVGYGKANSESMFSFDGQTNYLTIDGGHYSNTYGNVTNTQAKPSLINVTIYSNTYITINGGTLEMVCTAETLNNIEGNHSIIYSMPMPYDLPAARIKITGGNFITRLPNYTGNASDIAGKVFNLWLYGASKLDITGGTFECPGTCVRTHYANFPESCFKIDGENVLFENAYNGLWFNQSKYNSGVLPLGTFKVRNCEYGLRTGGTQSVVVNGANISDCTYGSYNYSGSTITIQGTSSITGTSYGFKHEGSGTATLKKGCIIGNIEGEVTYID